jgi:hypothetical protein
MANINSSLLIIMEMVIMTDEMKMGSVASLEMKMIKILEMAQVFFLAVLLNFI